MPFDFDNWRRDRNRRRHQRQGERRFYLLEDFFDIYHYGDGYDESEDVEMKPVKPKPQKPAKPEPEKIKVIKCDFNIVQNTKEHRTDEYDITEQNDGNDGERPKLVVRRGQPFNIMLEFNRHFDEKKDDLKLIFKFGKSPSPINGTLIDMILSDKDEPNQWGAKIQNNNGNLLTVTIFTPPSLYVGKWEFNVDFIKKSDQEQKIFRYEAKDPIYILFNPWCKEDATYMPDERLLDEYILNEIGKIYFGNTRQIGGRDWNFGQFQDKVLDSILYLLDKHESKPLKATLRGDPVHVSRKLSQLINCQDDDGVLTGNWSGEYEGGTSPMKWKGSVKILEEFFKTKEPVSYGQCWVFSGVLTTACRTLGIPARSVTNFASAHDTDESITIDKIFNEDGENLGISGDSVWNFHVWNDAWMKRPDLPKGYDGWQAVDATPQEESSNQLFCCGPCPLTAIKKGEVNLPYDAPFIYGEVNADIVHWTLQKNGELKKKCIKKNGVGKFISTHIPCCLPKRTDIYWRHPCQDDEWEDVTLQYKFEEGTAEERMSVKTSNRKGCHSCKEVYDQPENEDVEFELCEKESRMFGQDFEVVLTIKNNSKQNRTVSGNINVSTVKYTGKLYAKVKKQKYGDTVIKPGQTEKLVLKVAVDDYMDKLAEQCEFDLCECFVVKETKQTSVEDANFRLGKPDLILKTDRAEVKVGEKVKVQVSFTNPLNVDLTNVELSIEGPGLQKPIVYREGKSRVKGNATYTNEFELRPVKKGKRKILVSFNAKQIEMVEGTCEILVKPE